MTLEDVKNLLRLCQKNELRDHAFGDREVSWYSEDGREVACGYFSGTTASVSVNGTEVSFVGEQARELSQYCVSMKVERNDETGPRDYSDGQIMPGLTLAGVRDEICTPPAPVVVFRGSAGIMMPNSSRDLTDYK